MGITETKHKHTQQHHIMKTNISKHHKIKYNFYWSAAQTFDHHGVRVIISSDLNKHIINQENLENHNYNNGRLQIDRQPNNDTEVQNAQPQFTYECQQSIKDHNDPEGHIITNPQKIKQLMTETYSKWAPSNPTHQLQDFPNWTKEYEPIVPPEENIFATVKDPISYKELIKTIRHLLNNKVAGATGIPYEFWKNANESHIQLLLNICNEILQSQIPPKDWIHDNIFPSGNLNHTARKIFTKILYNRIATILRKEGLLSNSNWTGLPERNTAGSIH
ncbi:hypothetical protein Glove_423g41 [Diversispora epigaea]|uniref:Reverse transcriptase domain-containing protein n=1 Tax=Diversispora epigaea TaxID=1348612 RepID=A0A397GUN9_9GLOM|nr:hypothetical protein Glove_423g41 [Diversispora epigaea]